MPKGGRGGFASTLGLFLACLFGSFLGGSFFRGGLFGRNFFGRDLFRSGFFSRRLFRRSFFRRGLFGSGFFCRGFGGRFFRCGLFCRRFGGGFLGRSSLRRAFFSAFLGLLARLGLLRVVPCRTFLNAGGIEEAGHAVARLGAHAEPVTHPVLVQLHASRIVLGQQRVVGAE